MKEPKKSDDRLADGLSAEFINAIQQQLQTTSGSKSRKLYLAIYNLLLSGYLPPDSQVPASRQLASVLGYGRNTVTAAYQQLADEGLLYTAKRGGTRVKADFRQRATAVAAHPVNQRRIPVSLSRRGVAATSTDRPKALSPGEPDATLFPRHMWSRALAQAARAPDLQLAYRNDAGEIVLRQAIARYLATWRSLLVDPERILITASTRQSLAVAAGLYADAGDNGLVESPGYTGVQQAWRMLGMQLRPLEIDTQGLCCPDSLEGVRLLYTTPCFQYPLGPSLLPARRVQLLGAAAKAGTVLFEDDYDSEFRDDSQPRPALSGDADAYGATVLHAGTFSKLMFPGVRLGWLVLPAEHVRAGIGLLRSMGGGHNAVQQRAVAALLDNGTVARHLVRARAEYKRRRSILTDALNSGPLSVRRNSGGLSLVLDLPSPVSLDRLVHALQDAELGAQPLTEFCLEKPGHGMCSALVVGTGNVDEENLPATIKRLHEVCGS